METLELPELKKFAEQNRYKSFDLGSCQNCLAAQCATQLSGDVHTLWNWTDFDQGYVYNRVPLEFADLCRELSYYDLHRNVGGAALAKMIDRLIQGTHPKQVADDFAAAVSDAGGW